MFQILWSAALKSHGHREASLLLDTGFWGLIALAVITSYMLTYPPVNRWGWVIATLMGYITALAGYTTWRLMRSDSHTDIFTYTSTLRTGMPLMAATLLTLLATTSGRLGLGLLSTPEMMADYAILFRAAALPIVAHQIIIIARFRQVFELHSTELEKHLPIVIGLVTGSVILLWLFSSFIDVLLGPAFIKAFSQYRVEGLLILSQSILWSAIALNDLVNTRSQTAGPVARATLLYFVLVLPLAWWFLSTRQISLPLFVPVHSVVMAGYFMTQARVMRSCGIRLTRTWLLTLTSFLGLSAMAFVS
jgi:O-antigen/teichoic acid export membrane protein